MSEILWSFQSSSLSPHAVAALFAHDHGTRHREMAGTYPREGGWVGQFRTNDGTLYHLTGTAEGLWSVRRGGE